MDKLNELLKQCMEINEAGEMLAFFSLTPHIRGGSITIAPVRQPHWTQFHVDFYYSGKLENMDHAQSVLNEYLKGSKAA